MRGNRTTTLIKIASAMTGAAIAFLAGWFAAFSVAPDKAEMENIKAELARIEAAALENHENADYEFISPLLMCESLPIDFPRVRAAEVAIQRVIEAASMRGDISTASVYFRDLNNGPWFGSNEREHFIPASLLKVPLMMTYLRMAESNPEVLDKTIIYDGNLFPRRQNYVYAEALVDGKTYSVKELIERMMVTSDNTAMSLLTEESLISLDTLERVYKDLGIASPAETPSYEIDSITYASFFRILYNGTYLSHEMSEYALKLMSTSAFSDGLRAGVPKSIPISHKFGERANPQTGERQLHDCGIVYAPGKPYLACIMTRGKDFDRLAAVISEISRELYMGVILEGLRSTAP